MKYAISTKLKELGFTPYIIGAFYDKLHYDISFIKNYSNLIIVKKFTEIKKNDFDILMVNSDQTWKKKYLEYFYDYAFLYFSRHWKIPKFIYGASLGYTEWKFDRKDEKIAKFCLKSFKGISVREIGAIERINKHLGIKPIFVLDPTFLIDKKYYLNFINEFKKNNLISQKKLLFTYLLTEEKEIIDFINDSSIELNYTIFKVKENHTDSVKKFLYGIYHCEAVVTNSYHGTLFSIIFQKPFVTFIYKGHTNDRFNSLKDIFKIGERIVLYGNRPDISLLTTPLNIDQNLMNSLKSKSIDFIKRNLKTFKHM